MSTKLDETIVNGSRVFIENGEVKTELNEEIQQNNGDMSIEDLRKILKAEITMIYALSNENAWRKSGEH